MKAGDKVEYKVGDQWRAGVIHGVKKAQDIHDRDLVLGYLVDTGEVARIDYVTHDKRDDAVTELANKIVDDPKNKINNFMEAVEKVEKDEKLPKSKLVTEEIKQPKQVEVSPDNIRPAK